VDLRHRRLPKFLETLEFKLKTGKQLVAVSEISFVVD